MFKRTVRQNQSWSACFLALALLWLAAPAFAQEALLTSDVSVDMVGTDAADARTQAMKKAEKEGFIQLLDRLAPDQKDSILKLADDAKISAMVKGTEVLEEKVSGNRYRATLRLTYNAIELSALVEKRTGASGVNENVQKSNGVLILPLYEDNMTTLQLWEPSNRWINAWRKVNVEVSGGGLVVPYGDSIDTTSNPTQGMSAATYASLTPLINRYGVRDAILLKARYIPGQEPLLEVTRRQLGPTQDESLMFSYRPDAQEDTQAFFERVARDLADQFSRQRDEAMSRRAASVGVTTGRIMVITPYTTLASWTDVRTRLLKLSVVDKLELLAISPRQVDSVIHYRGTEDALVKAVTAQNLRVVPATGYWVISRD